MEKDFLNKRCFIHSWIILLISSLALTHIYDEMFGAKIIIRTSSSSSGIKIAKRFVLSPSCHPFPIRLLWPHPSAILLSVCSGLSFLFGIKKYFFILNTNIRQRKILLYFDLNWGCGKWWNKNIMVDSVTLFLNGHRTMTL